MADVSKYFNNDGGQIHISTTPLTIVAGVPTYTSTERTSIKVTANLVGDVLSLGELARDANIITFPIVGELYEGSVTGVIAATQLELEVALNGSTIEGTLETKIGEEVAVVWTIGDGTDGRDYAFNAYVASFSINPDITDVTRATITLTTNKGTTKLALS